MVDIAIVGLVTNFLIGFLYTSIKYSFYNSLFLQNSIRNYWYGGIPFWKRIIIQCVYPLQFLDTLFNGCAINSYCNPLAVAFPALPITPTWVSDDNDRSYFAHTNGQGVNCEHLKIQMDRIDKYIYCIGLIALISHVILILALLICRIAEMIFYFLASIMLYIVRRNT